MLNCDKQKNQEIYIKYGKHCHFCRTHSLKQFSIIQWQWLTWERIPSRRILKLLRTLRRNRSHCIESHNIPSNVHLSLKKLLDDPEADDLIIWDVRTGASRADSDQMIQTAIREDLEDFESWSNKYRKILLRDV